MIRDHEDLQDSSDRLPGGRDRNPHVIGPVISGVTDTGDIKNEDLLLAVNPVAIGAVFTEPRFRQLLETTIRPLYEARGHLSVTFPKVLTEPAKDVKGLVVTVQVEQGPVYKLGSVGFAGSNVAADELKDLAKLKPGELANFDEVKAAQARLDDSFRHRGYLKTTSKIARTLHDAQKTADVVFQLEPGPQFSFGKLDIVGLDISTEPELRKMWGLKPGKPFNPSYPSHFLDVVRSRPCCPTFAMHTGLLSRRDLPGT
jgi:outer membrane protein insertion porin family